MPPSQNPEVKEISQRMAHLHALLNVAKSHEIKPLWLEYRGLRERRRLIETGEAAAGGTRTAGQTTALEPGDANDEPVDIQGAKGSAKPRKSVKIHEHDDKRSSSPAARGESETDE